MDKVKKIIWITGLMGVGKSTLSHSLSKKTGFPVFDIDRYRRDINAFTIDLEELAWSNMLSDINRSKSECVILENSGFSKKMESIVSNPAIKIFHLRLLADFETLVKRCAKREKGGYTDPPFCYQRKNESRHERLLKMVQSRDNFIEKVPVSLLIDTSKVRLRDQVGVVLKEMKKAGFF